MLRAWKRVIPGWDVERKLKADVRSRKQDLRGTGHPSLPDTKFFVFQTFSVKENCCSWFLIQTFPNSLEGKMGDSCCLGRCHRLNQGTLELKASMLRACANWVLLSHSPLTDTHSPNWALVHWCSVHALLPRARVNPRLHCIWYCGWGCQGLLQQRFVAMLLPTGSLGTSRHSLVSQSLGVLSLPLQMRHLLCFPLSAPLYPVNRAACSGKTVFCAMRKGLDHFVFINFIYLYVLFFFFFLLREVYLHMSDLCNI